MYAWEKFWMVIVGLFCISILSIILWFSLAEKPVVRYELASYVGVPAIRVDIENSSDRTIILSGKSYEDAIAIIDSMNASLERHPRK